MAEDKQSFITSLPGILTGLAAVLAAAGGLIYHNRSKPAPKPKRAEKQISEPAKPSREKSQKASGPESQLPEGFKEEPPYNGDCSSPPVGSTCIQYRDQYRWLVNDKVAAKRDQVGVWDGHKVLEAVGKHARYRHILGTQYVQELPK